MVTPQMFVKLVSSGAQLQAQIVGSDDSSAWSLGDDGDVVFFLRSTALGANTFLDGVLVGTPVTPALAADSAIISNTTEDGDILFAVRDGDHSKGLLHLDGSAGSVTIVDNLTFDGTTLTVDGDLQFTGAQEISTSSGALTIAPVSTLILDIATGNAAFKVVNAAGHKFFEIDSRTNADNILVTMTPPAITDSAASNTNNATLELAASTITLEGSTGVDSMDAGLVVRQRTITDTSSLTIAQAQTVYIAGAPIAAGSVTITEPLALWVDAGVSRFDGNIDLNGSGTLLNVGSSGNDWTKYKLVVEEGRDGAVEIVVNNTTVGTAAVGLFQVASTYHATGGGDPLVHWRINGSTTQNWYAGVDNTDAAGRRFTIGTNLPGAADAIRITTAKAVSFDDENSSYTTFSSDYVCEGCGKSGLESFYCCGVVAWHDDVLALRELQLSPTGLQHMAKLGIYEIDGPDTDAPGSTFINFQKAMKYTWAGMWQNRERMDAQNEAMDERLTRIEQALGV